MSSDSHDRLDQLLGDWAAACATDERHTSRLSSQIVAAAREEANAFADKPIPAEHYRETTAGESWNGQDWGGKLMIGGGGLLLFLVLGGALLYKNIGQDPARLNPSVPGIASSAGNSRQTVYPPSQTPDAAWLGGSVVAAKQQLLAETNSVFDNQLTWLADGDREMWIELNDQASASVEEFMLVRVVVAQRAAPHARWSTVWQTDVISRNEALVEVSAVEIDGSSLALWTYRLPDGEVAVDMDLVLDQLTQLQTSSSAVLQAGQPTRVGCSSEDGVEHCVFQTVMPLNPARI